MITFTDDARSKAMEMMETHGNDENYGIRISVKRNGCQFNYHLDWEKKKLPGDAVIKQDKIILYADFDSFHWISDVVIDYHKQDEQEGFIMRHQIFPCSVCKASGPECH